MRKSKSNKAGRVHTSCNRFAVAGVFQALTGKSWNQREKKRQPFAKGCLVFPFVG